MARTAVLARNATSRVFTLLAAAVRLVGAIIGGLILIYAVFWFFQANPGNPLVTFTHGFRTSFGWFTTDLFGPDADKLKGTINAALAGLIYVVVASLVSKLIARFAPATKKE